jgi:hypothetical protein
MTMPEQDFKELNTASMITGIGRKATDAELINYLSREQDIEPIDLETAFSKYKLTLEND